MSLVPMVAWALPLVLSMGAACGGGEGSEASGDGNACMDMEDGCPCSPAQECADGLTCIDGECTEQPGDGDGDGDGDGPRCGDGCSPGPAGCRCVEAECPTGLVCEQHGELESPVCVTEACEAPTLEPAGVWYFLSGDGVRISLFFYVGVDEPARNGCFTTGSELYADSRIELRTPNGEPVLVLPDDFLVRPAQMEVWPMNWSACPPYFGEDFEGTEVEPDLRATLIDHPVLYGTVRLCNVDEQCDEREFALTGN